MKRLLIIGNSDLDINLFRTSVYSDNIKIYSVSEREVQLRRDDDFVKIEAVNKIVKEYNANERKKIAYENPKILMITFSTVQFIYQVIKESKLPEGLYIDDFKSIRTLEEVLEEMN